MHILNNLYVFKTRFLLSGSSPGQAWFNLHKGLRKWGMWAQWGSGFCGHFLCLQVEVWLLSVLLQPPARPVPLERIRQLSHPKYTLLWLPLAVIFSHSHIKTTHAYEKVIIIPALERLMSFTVKDVHKGPKVLQNRKMQRSFGLLAVRNWEY